ncbi:MAG: hypothetical protein EBX47_09675 [Synechococcaceae bacterium WB8_1B_057]|nr:hypothetical protein [Synechococcaceae bacterium WB6_1A_059]NDG79680.1 hypothetical protein [Synechococcaceae bacterium WB8_1B_057]
MRILDLIESDNTLRTGDIFALELDNGLLIESVIVGFMADGLVIQGDDVVLSYLKHQPVKESITKFTEMQLAIMEGGGDINDLQEAEYQGRDVPLGKPMAGDVKKSKVYVKGPKGNVVKVNFGDKKMKIKKSNPKRRKSFRARHNCDNPGPRHKARYWSCRAWE